MSESVLILDGSPHNFFHMKTYTSILAFLFMLLISCGNPSEKESETDHAVLSPSARLLWKSDTTFTGSESALYYEPEDIIFVSCGNTQPLEKDGDGFIAIVRPDGSVVNMEWTTGLHAPKGMAIMDESLYVTDIDEIVQIDLKTGEIQKKTPVENAEFLNDAATDGTYIYFSDMRTAKVYRMNHEGYEIIAENVPDINGLETHENVLYGLNREGLIRFDDKGGYEVLTDKVPGGDGLVILDENTFIASQWAGKIYYIDGDVVTNIVDTEAEKSNTADIYFIPDREIILVPTFLKNEIAAYQLE